MTAWKLYRDTINQNCLAESTDRHGLAYWRNNLFAIIMIYSVPVGLLAAIPGSILSFLTDKFFLGVCDITALVLILLISFSGSLSIVLRKTLFIIVLYILATVLIYYLGSFGPGLLYLLLITIFCVLIFSNRVAYLSVAINMAICFTFGFIIYFKVLNNSFIHQYTVAVWFAISINLVVVSVLILLLLPLIFNGIYKSNERYEMVSKATSDIICDWDLEKDITVYSENIYDMFGYAPGEVDPGAEWWWSKVHPDDKLRVDTAVADSLAGNSLYLYIEYRFRCADGSYKYILDRAYILRDANNKAIRVIGAMQDINQLKEREHWLKLMESVITNATDAVLIMEADGEDKKAPGIVYANEAYAKMAGYDQKEELMGLKTHVLYGEQSSVTELEQIRDAIDKGEIYKGEIINYKKNGQAFWNNKALSPVRDETGKLTHWISIERDVTERNNYIKAIEDQNKKLKEISWMQSHIVRAPLTRIMGLVNLLTSEPPVNIDPTEVLGYIKESADEFDVIIRGIIKNTETDMMPDEE